MQSSPDYASLTLIVQRLGDLENRRDRSSLNDCAKTETGDIVLLDVG